MTSIGRAAFMQVRGARGSRGHAKADLMFYAVLQAEITSRVRAEYTRDTKFSGARQVRSLTLTA
jgi:hypothetical protein